MSAICLRTVFATLCDDLEIDNGTKEYCLKRFDAEGIRFFTVALPRLSKSVLASLEAGVFIRPTDFAWKGSSLRYFRSLLSKIFLWNGVVNPATEVLASGLRDLRQLCDYMYKLAFDFSEQEIAQAEEKFVHTDESLASIDLANPFIEEIRKNFEHYILPSLPKTVDEFLLKGSARYGPGSFAKHSRDPVAEKRGFPHFIEKVALSTSVQPHHRAHSGFFKNYPSCPEKIRFVRNEDKYSEVLFVPKDSRGPRVISREPKLNLQVQLAFFDLVTPALERATKGRINFESQEVNRSLVEKASVDRKFATLDLKDGSDRVSYSLAKKIFAQWTGLINLFNLSRSTEALLPSGRIIALNKVAGMGSGFTFPLMALLIHLAIATNISRRSALTFGEASKLVYVYGDDVVVPTCYVTEAYQGLSMVGLEVNVAKSFCLSKFRESCGLDCYDGIEVGPVRLKLTGAELGRPTRVIPSLTHSGVLQLERHCRELKKAGLWKVADYFYTAIERILKTTLPNISGVTNALGRYVFNKDLVPEHDKQHTVVVPVATHEDVPYMNKYVFLRSRLVPTADDNMAFIRPTKMAPFGIVSVPRRIKLVKRRLYGSVLKGIEL